MRVDSPLITVVVPNLNGARYLQETLESIVNQRGPRVELIVVDGGSTDGSHDILSRYRDRIDTLIVEPDRGQADAIMKGARVGRGKIFNWINSDDVLLPGALAAVGEGMADVDCFAGAVWDVTEDGTRSRLVRQRRLTAAGILRHPWRGSSYHQPGVWLLLERFIGCGGLDRDLHFAFDREMMIRYLSRGARVTITDRPLAAFRLHPASKTSTQADRFLDEQMQTLRKVAREGPEELQALARKHIERLAWWSELDSICRAAAAGSRTAAAARILRRSLSKPRVRLGRASARALIRTLFQSRERRGGHWDG